jgi:hypothetical protein
MIGRAAQSPRLGKIISPRQIMSGAHGFDALARWPRPTLRLAEIHGK